MPTPYWHITNMHSSRTRIMRDDGVVNRMSPPSRGQAMNHAPAAPPWQEAVFRVLKKGGVQQVAYVPDAAHSVAIRDAIAYPAIRDIVLTTEEEGVAVVSGAWLGGQRAALLMQSSGVGNCVNMFSLLTACQFPLL